MIKILYTKLYFPLFLKIIYYMAKILCKNLIKIRSQKLCKKIYNNFKGPYLFKPYGVLDCVSLHSGILENLKKKKDSHLFKDEQFKIDFLKFVQKKKCKKGFFNFQKVLLEGCKKNDFTELYYPILDTFIRKIPWKYFFTGFELKKNFFKEIKKIVNKNEKFYSRFNTLFLADTAYFDNHLAKQIFLNKNKNVIYLNPNGKILQYCNINYSELSAKNYENFYHKYLNEIENYLEKRYSGKSNNEFDTKFSFNQSVDKKKHIIKKKVLFLHAFRDSNNTTWNENQVFHSYIDWVDFTLKVINKKNDFKNWYIKKHPSGKYYQNEKQILNKFIKMYNIPKSVIEDCPSTSEILDYKMPVYTNSGTIILETATKGYGTYFCKLRFNKKYGFFTSSKREWEKIVKAPYEIASKNYVERSVQKAAKYKLWFIHKKNIPELCPTQPIRRNGYFAIITVLYNQIFNTIFLKSKNFRIPKL